MFESLKTDIGGVAVEDLLELGRIHELQQPVVYASGSLVEGFGNSLSDIDIFVISDRVVEGEIVTHKRDFTINIVFYQHRRIDYEFYKPEFPESLAARLHEIRVGEEFVAEKLSAHEELFIHRLKIGVPLLNEPDFLRLRNQFDFELFRRYLVQQSIHMIDGAIEDITGYAEDNDWDSALLRCSNLVGLATDAFCYHNGCTNTLPKWRHKKLKLLKDSKAANYTFEQFWSLSYPSIDLHSTGDKEKHVLACLQFANHVVESIQNQPYDH
jgi:predicted nucleotidyltransferase